jgi:hypothetical protein
MQIVKHVPQLKTLSEKETKFLQIPIFVCVFRDTTIKELWIVASVLTSARLAKSAQLLVLNVMKIHLEKFLPPAIVLLDFFKNRIKSLSVENALTSVIHALETMPTALNVHSIPIGKMLLYAIVKMGFMKFMKMSA